jgi:hypothetical protein
MGRDTARGCFDGQDSAAYLEIIMFNTIIVLKLFVVIISSVEMCLEPV